MHRLTQWWLPPRRDIVWGLIACSVLVCQVLDRWWLTHQREMYDWRLQALAERYQAGRAGMTLEERGFVLDRDRSRPPTYLVYWK